MGVTGVQTCALPICNCHVYVDAEVDLEMAVTVTDNADRKSVV